MYDFTVLFEDVFIFPPSAIVGTFRCHCEGTGESFQTTSVEVAGMNIDQWILLDKDSSLRAACLVYAHTNGYRAMKEVQQAALRDYRDARRPA